jgi:thiol-disulfide isomerase/thioredoxin
MFDSNERWRRWRMGWAVAGLALVIAACAAPKPHGPAARLDFSVKDLAGKDVRLADFRGRPLIINFWATYCGPCKAEMPALIELGEKYKDRNLTILGISIDDSPAEIEAFRGQFGRSFPANYPLLLGRGQDEMLEAYGASVAIPVSWLVRADGTVSGKTEGPQTKQWFEAQIKAMF